MKENEPWETIERIGINIGNPKESMRRYQKIGKERKGIDSWIPATAASKRTSVPKTPSVSFYVSILLDVDGIFLYFLILKHFQGIG